MKAMIFAAGRGERMRPLTDTCPKPLLKVRGRPLIVWHILGLVRAGVTEIVINHSHLGHMIEEALGNGSQFGASITYSHEPTPLETAGGVANALHLLGTEPFIAIAADVYMPYFDYAQCLDVLQESDVWGNPYPAGTGDVAWLYLTPNPFHNPDGDFALNAFQLSNEGSRKWNFAGIGVYRPEMFEGIGTGAYMRFGELMRKFIDCKRVGGEIYEGPYVNVGTMAQLDELNVPLARRAVK